MPYEYTPAQRRYLKRKFAKDRDLETCCGCSGCETCTGFIRNCTCDHDTSFLQSRHEHRTPTEMERNFRRGIIVPTGSDTPPNNPTEDPEASRKEV